MSPSGRGIREPREHLGSHFQEGGGTAGGPAEARPCPSCRARACARRAFPSVQPAEFSEQTCGRASAIPVFEN